MPRVAMLQSLSPAEDPAVTVVQSNALAQKEPLVSVCIITYNQEHYIREALDSVLRQETDFDYEIIVGDDCSTDGTRAVLERYQREHPARIRLHLHEEHYEGVPGRKNMITNLRGARGRYVALLDGDDYWISRDKLQRQIDLLKTRSDVSFCFHDARAVFEGSEPQAIYGKASFLESEKHSAMDVNQCFTSSEVIKRSNSKGSFSIPSSSMVFRRKLFSPVPDWYWDIWFGDVVMQVYFSQHGPACYHHSLLSCYRRTPQSMTVQYKKSVDKADRVLDEIRIMADVAGLSKDRNLAWGYRAKSAAHRHNGEFTYAVFSLTRSAYHYARHFLQSVRASFSFF